MPRGIEANVAPTIAIPPPRAECLALIPNANPIIFKIKDVIMTGFSSDENMELYLITSFKCFNMYRKDRIPSRLNIREATACPCLFTGALEGETGLAAGLLVDVLGSSVTFSGFPDCGLLEAGRIVLGCSRVLRFLSVAAVLLGDFTVVLLIGFTGVLDGRCCTICSPFVGGLGFRNQTILYM